MKSRFRWLDVRGCLAKTFVACHAILFVVHAASSPNLRLSSTGSAVSPNSTCGDWVAWITPTSAPAVVMQVVSKDYIDVERNFIRLMEMNSVFTRHDLYLMCADEESLQYFDSTMGIRCISLAGFDDMGSHDNIWKLRVRVLSCLVEWGQDVIMSDADALWLGDPMQDFAAPPAANSSIVASRGSYPRKLGDQWGSTICMGFILFRTGGNGDMREFLEKIQQLVLENGDDQVAVNSAASHLGIEWDKQGGDMRYEESQGFGFGTIDSLTDDHGWPFAVTLLPHNKYTRQCLQTPLSEITVVAHCRSPKRAGAKIDWMRKAGLWSLENYP